MTHDFIILGAGPSGLLAAYLLKRKGHSIALIEKAPRAGGWVKSELRGSCRMEWGPHTLMADHSWLQLFNDLNLNPQFSNAADKARYIWKEGRSERVPMNPVALVSTPLLSFSAKRKLIAQLFRSVRMPSKDVSIREFVRLWLHDDIVHYMVDPFVGGVAAGSIDELSAETFFKPLWDALQDGKPLLKALRSLSSGPRRMVSFSEGLQTFVDALASQIHDDLFKDINIQKIHRLDRGWRVVSSEKEWNGQNLILACPSYELPSLIREFISPLHNEYLGSISYADVGLWNVAFRRPQNFKTGFGCLVPSISGEVIKGSLWNSEVFEGRCSRDQLLTAQFFSSPRCPESPDEHLPFLKKLIGTEEDPLWSAYKKHSRAIPQLKVGHLQKIGAIRSELPRGMYLVGNYLDGVGLSHVKKTVETTLSSFL